MQAYDVWFECDHPDLRLVFECEAEGPEHAAEMFARAHDEDPENRPTCAGNGTRLVVVVSSRGSSRYDTFEVSAEAEVYRVEVITSART